jgi:hypothetical protein
MFRSSIFECSAAINYVPAATTNFEPILDIPALGTFVLVALIFGALILRTSQVEASVQERNLALENLRAVKSKELIEDHVEAEVAEALRRYEDAVKKEEGLRDVIPGIVRIVPPSSADSKEEEARVIAKRFLGKDYDIGVSREPAEEGSNLSRIATTVIPLILILFLLYSVFAFSNLDSMASSGMIYNFYLATPLPVLE